MKKVLAGIFFPALIYVATFFIVLEMNKGNGSFAGLGILSFTVVSVPMVFLYSCVYVYLFSEKPAMRLFWHVFWFYLALSVSIVVFSIVAMVGDF